MAKTSRRNLLAVAAGASAAVAAAAVKPKSAAAHGEQHHHVPISGPLATATVSFGSWIADAGTDRFVTPNPGSRNQHQVTPNEVTIREGGTVNFIIAGFHLIAVYDDGTQPEQINVGTATFIDDQVNRIYRGLNPTTAGLPQDRVEVLQFPRRGTYLVICAVRGHFVNDNMYGFVRVLP
jgi:plastocyanin